MADVLTTALEVTGVLAMLAAAVLWSPLAGLFLLGVFLVVASFLIERRRA
ncbi:MAG: hypothetical protein IPN92_21065 [Chromatiaceae bacterium]|nr:hypothetical protein [Chromatiaceae bacterium]